jgi:hypothetical protein
MNKKDLIEIRGRQCELCKKTKWRGQPIPLEIHHVNPPSEKEEDLQLLCPNCHALTPNYRGRGIKTAKQVKDSDIIAAAETANNIRQLLLSLGLVAKGGNYEVIRKKIVALGLQNKFVQKTNPESVCLNCGFVFISTEDLKFCSQTCCNQFNGKHLPRATKINWPDNETLIKLAESCGYVEAGRRLGVSDNAIRKRIKKVQ